MVVYSKGHHKAAQFVEGVPGWYCRANAWMSVRNNSGEGGFSAQQEHEHDSQSSAVPAKKHRSFVSICFMGRHFHRTKYTQMPKLVFSFFVPKHWPKDWDLKCGCHQASFFFVIQDAYVTRNAVT